MTTKDWLSKAIKQLKEAGIATARLDALVLLEDVTGIDRAKLLAEPDRELSAADKAKLKKLLSQRAKHVPLAYVLGRSEFYGRSFVITPAVLQPRPESETMIDLLKDIVGSSQAARNKALKRTQGAKSPKKLPSVVRIADVGAGSGALGITAKMELPEAEIDLLEIDEKALQVAKTNVDLFTLNISTKKSDLLANSDQDYDILLCNLPYVPDGHTINQAALHEPKIAIFGGPDGLDVYRKLFKQLSEESKQVLYILTEALPPQQLALHKLAEEHGYDLLRTDDFIQVFTPPSR